MDLILRHARVNGAVVDIGVEDGVIAALEPDLEGTAKLEMDARGMLTVPAFVNGHLHACKSLWRTALLKLHPKFDFTDTAARFKAIAEVKRGYIAADVLARAEATVRDAVRHGTGAMRLFADVDEDAGLRAFEGLMQLKSKLEPWMQVQVAAFPQNGVDTARQSTEALMVQALEMGADIVGGIPWLEPTVDAQLEHIELVLTLAQRFQKPAHFVLDDTDDPTSRTAEFVARKTLEHGMVGRVCGTQANALAYADDTYAAEVIELVRRAGMTIFSNAHVALVTTPQRSQPAPRGHTRILELLRAGVPVATAQDDIDNPYYPFGRNDLLEVAQYMAHLAPLAWGEAVNKTLEMVTTTPARAIGLEGYGLRVGCRADMLVLEAADWFEALRTQAEKTLVILGGRVASRATRNVEIHV